MKVLVYFDGFYPGSGGIETHIRDLAHYIPSEFEVVADAIPGVGDDLDPSLHVRRFGPPNTTVAAEPQALNSKAMFAVRALFDILRLRAKRRYVRKARYDVIHFHSAGLGSALSKLIRASRADSLYSRLTDWSDLPRPPLLTVHGLSSLFVPDELLESQERRFITRFPEIICVDRGVEDRVRRYATEEGVAPRIHFIPNGVDVERFQPAPLNPSRVLRVGFAGRLERSRGLDMLDRILRGTDQRFHFVIAGLGSAREVSRFRESTRGLDVEFYPNLSYEEMPAFYSNVDILFNPVAVPGISRASLECMATGRPVLMSRMGGRYPVVDGVTGFLAGHDPRQYSAKLAWLADRPAAIMDCGQRAAAVVRAEFSAADLCRRVQAIYEGLSAPHR